MTSRTAAELLPCYREEHPSLNDPRVKKAARSVRNDPQLQARLREQTEFDAHVQSLIHSIEPPDDLTEKAAVPAATFSWRNEVTQPAFLAVGFSVLLLVGLLVFVGFNHLHEVPGQDAAEKMIELTREMTGSELEPVQTEAGKLGDWFFLKYGLENYSVPAEFAGYRTLGSRVFKQDGHPVAQIAVEENQMLFYVFRADDFDVDPMAADRWYLVEQDEWVAALRRHGQNCFMIAFRGSEEEMRKLLASHQKH